MILNGLMRLYYSILNFQITPIILFFQRTRKEKSSLVVVINPHSSGLSGIQNNSISLFFNIAVSLIMQFLLFYILSSIQLYSIMSVIPNPSNSTFWSFKRFSTAQLYPHNANRDSLISKCRLPPTDWLWSLPTRHSPLSRKLLNQSLSKGRVRYVI